MQGLPVIELARVLGDAHRAELSETLRARSSPRGGLRAAMGRRLVRTGMRLLNLPPDSTLSSARAIGA